MKGLKIIFLCSLLVVISCNANAGEKFIVGATQNIEINAFIKNDTCNNYELVGIQKIKTEIVYPIMNPAKKILKDLS